MQHNFAVYEGKILLAPSVATNLMAAGVTLESLEIRGRTINYITHDHGGIELLARFKYDAPTLMLSPVKDGGFDYRGPFKPYMHQRVTADFIAKNPRCIVLSSPGCVDSDTEYLSPNGWVKISDYAGGQVTQYDNDTGVASLVQPLEYIKAPCVEMIRIRNHRGVDQLLSPEHRVLARFAHGERSRVVTAADVLAKHLTQASGFTGTFPNTFVGGQAGVAMTDDELRLHVVVSANGFIGRDTPEVCTVRLRGLKKERGLEELLIAAGVEYSKSKCRPAELSQFKFRYPRDIGVSALWSCSHDQLRVVTAVLSEWDEITGYGAVCNSYADFAQYAYAATGRTSVMHPFKYVSVYSYTTSQEYGPECPSMGSGRCRGVTFQPSTDGFKYCFRVPTGFLVLRRNGCIFVTGNCGKTASAIWAVEFLMQQGVLKKALVLCPLSCIEDVWGRELFRLTPRRKASVLSGPVKKRLQMIRERADWVVTNHDAAAHMWEVLADKATGFDVVIIDENSAFKTEGASRTRGLKKILVGKRAVLMTGTPTAQAPTDAYMACKIINANAPQTMAQFTNETMIRVSQLKWVPRKDSHMTVAKYLDPAIRYDKADCLDLPPISNLDRKVALTDAQSKAIADLKRDWVTENARHKVVAVNAAARIGKILQVCQGAVISDSGVMLVDAAPRLQACIDHIEESNSKTIVFANYRAVVDNLSTELGRRYGVVTVHGDVSPRKRLEIFRAFENDSDVRVMVAHPQVVSHGLTLTAASMTTWYGPITKREIYFQANERTDRPGQKHYGTIYNLFATREEELLINAFKNAAQSQSLLLELKKLLVLPE